jgi:hypothetical protein
MHDQPNPADETPTATIDTEQRAALLLHAQRAILEAS